MCALALAAVLAAGASQSAWAGGFNPDPVFPVGPISGSVSHQIPKLERVASALAGRHAVVNCWSNRDWTREQVWQGDHDNTRGVDASGITYFGTHRIQLSPFECQVLAQVIAGSPHQPLFTAWAVTVLAHESAHASASESRTRRSAARSRPSRELPSCWASRSRRRNSFSASIGEPSIPPTYLCTARRRAQRPRRESSSLISRGDGPSLRPLSDVAARVASSLPGWKDEGGASAIGPLGPCGGITSRAEELSRFGEFFKGPRSALVDYTAATVKTKRDFSRVLSRWKQFPRCDLRFRRTQDRERHSSAIEFLGKLPSAVTRISPRVNGFRVVFRNGKTFYNDRIEVFDPARRTMFELYIQTPAGALPVSTEVAAVRAMLHSS